MGGFQAINAAADAKARGDGSALCAVVAICPAPESGLLRFLRSDRRPEFRCDAEASAPWLETVDSHAAAASSSTSHPPSSSRPRSFRREPRG